MARRLAPIIRPVAAAAAAALLIGADETSLGPTVGNVLITKPIPGGNLSLSNKAAVKTVEALDLRVTGAEPIYNVTGQIFCKNGARLVEAQAIIGKTLLHNEQPITMASYGKSPKLTSIAGRSDANVEIPVKLTVIRKDSDALVDLGFNPARTFKQKLNSFTAKGGSAVAYLRQAEAFEMPVDVNLVGWCRMPANANSVLAGKTYAGMATRSVPVTILYGGDPAIVDGTGVRGAAGQQVKARVQPAPARKVDSTKPRRRDD